jgi:hypothetical protein
MRSDEEIIPKGFCSDWQAISVQGELPLPTPRMLSNTTTDTPFRSPSITFQIRVICLPEGLTINENRVGSGGLILGFRRLGAVGPMYWKPHFVARARMARDRST